MSDRVDQIQARPKKWRLYIDESGDHHYSDSEVPESRYLGLTGCFFELEYYETVFRPKFEGMKLKYFSRDVDDTVILMHRKELVNQSGHFSVLKDKEKEIAFNHDLLELCKEVKFKIISVVIDKKSHKNRWIDAYHPYHYCLLALVQRYISFLNKWNLVGDVMAEGRGDKEDMQLKIAFSKLYASGTPQVSADIFTTRLTSKEIKIKKKEQNIAGLQLADLLAHPCKQDILLDHQRIEKYGGKFGRKLMEIAKEKYNKWELKSRVDGFGKVFIK